MSITKAVLACGGWSTRFLPTTKSYAKQLLPVLSKPQILYALDECIQSGITDICIIHRDHETTINQFFEPNAELDAYLSTTGKEKYMADYHRIVDQIKNMVFLPQTEAFPYGNGSPILVAEKFINHDSFAYFYADDFILENTTGDYLKKIINTFESENADAVCGATIVDMSEINKLSSVKYLQDNRVDTVVEKPEPQDAPSNHSFIGRFVFNSKIFSYLQSTAIDRGELWLANAVSNMAKDRDNTILTQLVPQDSKWLTTGDPLNWLKVNLALAYRDPDIGPKLKQFANSLI